MRAHRGATIVIGLILSFLALTLLLIGANSPYTHANLNPAYDAAYARTEQILVGASPAGRITPVRADGGDQVARGESVFVTAGCAGCHALEGQGGAVAKAIAGVDQALLEQKVRTGTAGMPPFSAEALTDAQVADVGAFLRSIVAALGTAAPTVAPSASAAPATAAPAATSSPAPGPSSPPSASPSAGSELLASGKHVYETAGEVGCVKCHGPQGKGGITETGDSAPDVRGATEQKLRSALGGGAALMSYIKLTDQEIEAVVRYLEYLNTGK